MNYKLYQELIIQKSQLVETVNFHTKQIEFHQTLANLYQETAQELECRLTELDLQMAELQNGSQLEWMVFKKHVLEGKPLYEVADDLGYSYNWILKVSAKVKKKVKL